MVMMVQKLIASGTITIYVSCYLDIILVSFDGFIRISQGRPIVFHFEVAKASIAIICSNSAVQLDSF